MFQILNNYQHELDLRLFVSVLGRHHVCLADPSLDSLVFCVPFTDGSSCCRVKIVRDSENADMDGRYTYKETSNGKRDPRCMDGCVYVKDGGEENEFCFMEVNKETNVEDQCEIVSTKKPVMTTG